MKYPYEIMIKIELQKFGFNEEKLNNIVSWCKVNFNNKGFDWNYKRSNRKWYLDKFRVDFIFQFKYSQDAFKFKLRWG